jgi:nicotinamidase/pyrazinamidase
MLVRVDVDTQNGFCHPKGGLYIPGAEKILPDVARLNREAEDRGFPLVGSVDTHESFSREFRENGGIWPVHCVKGTWDWLKADGTLPKRFLILCPSSDERNRERSNVAFYFEKDIYSMFDNDNAGPVLERLAGPGIVFQVYGVATEHCVRATALAIRERFPDSRVQVLVDAIAAVERPAGEQALADMKSRGIELVGSKELP